MEVQEISMKQWVHDTRKQIDACIQNVGQAKDTQFPEAPEGKIIGGRELSLAYTKLQEAKMWLGKVLEELGSELPAQFQDKA